MARTAPGPNPAPEVAPHDVLAGDGVEVERVVLGSSEPSRAASPTGPADPTVPPRPPRPPRSPVGPRVLSAAERAERAARPTRERILDAALVSFATTGFEATSLDQLAAELGVRKQTILYHFKSKPELLDAVIDQAALELAAYLEDALERAGNGFDRIEALVRSVFRLALRRPELLGLLRESGRLGPPAASRLVENLDPLVQRAREFLEAEMEMGHFRKSDARLLLFSLYSTVVGVATEVEVLRAVGIEPTLRTTAIRRRELLQFLRRALVEDDA